MRKKYIHFELVPVEEAEKVLKQESSPAKRNGKRNGKGNGKGKLAVKKSGKTANGRHAVPKKVEVLIPWAQ
jgi:hypothetical protein